MYLLKYVIDFGYKLYKGGEVNKTTNQVTEKLNSICDLGNVTTSTTHPVWPS